MSTNIDLFKQMEIIQSKDFTRLLLFEKPGLIIVIIHPNLADTHSKPERYLSGLCSVLHDVASEDKSGHYRFSANRTRNA